MNRPEYHLVVTWTGNSGSGTSSYAGYTRDHTIEAAGKPTIVGSSDPAFRGEPTRYNPEELLVASLSQCHMLWYLALCATAGVVVNGYLDRPSGVMVENADGSGQFESVTLRPAVRIAAAESAQAATELHERASQKCFIARSVNFPVRHEPVLQIGDE